MSYLLHNLLHFSRVLHASGMEVHPGRMPEIALALNHIDIGRHSDFYFTLRTLLVHRQQDLERFDEAFRLFWRPPKTSSGLDLRSLGERRSGTPQIELYGREPATAIDDSSAPTLSEIVAQVVPLTYAARAVSRTKDFADFSEEELNEALAMLDALVWAPPNRRTRRWTRQGTAAPGRVTDLRTVIRRSLRYGGELLEIPTRERKEKRRPLILLCDISGSMERYSRILLHFLHTLADGKAGMGRVEAFVFATRLTRITRELSSRKTGEAVSKVSQQVSDWSGGTKIGEALRTFNVEWARRTLAQRSVVLLISDGWDRGDPEVLSAEVSRLHRTCHRLIWLNPLLGSPDYQPLTRGMSAALPFIDDFLPVHNLESLEQLAEHLNSLPDRAKNHPQSRPA